MAVEKGEKIVKMLRAAMAAPSACNQQPWGLELHGWGLLLSCGYPAEEKVQQDRYDEALVHYVK